MEALSKITLIQPKHHCHHHHQPPLSISFHLHKNRPLLSFPRKSTTLSLPKPQFSSLKIKCSAQKSTTINPNSRNPFSFIRTPLTIAVATTAIFLSGFSHKPLPALAETPNTTAEETAVCDEEREKILEDYVASNPVDVQGLKSLMEVKIKNKKLPEAVEVLNRLIEVEPEETEWRLLRAHMYSYMGDTELSKAGFEEILAKDPVRVEAFHGLVMAVSQGGEESGGQELTGVVKRITEAIERCKKEKKKDEVRDFKLLVAQVRVIEGNYNEALKVYQELVKEEPRDFRPYLCQGIIYTLLRKKDEAEKQFDKYKRLVPQGHPYASYFDDNMLATKVFSQMAENERVKVGAKS